MDPHFACCVLHSVVEGSLFNPHPQVCRLYFPFQQTRAFPIDGLSDLRMNFPNHSSKIFVLPCGSNLSTSACEAEVIATRLMLPEHIIFVYVDKWPVCVLFVINCEIWLRSQNKQRPSL